MTTSMDSKSKEQSESGGSFLLVRFLCESKKMNNKSPQLSLRSNLLVQIKSDIRSSQDRMPTYEN